jgi:SAM-dependent methyltransferase
VDEESAAPFDVDLTRASIARVYDYLLGGKEYLDADRRAADAMTNVVPEAGDIARANRRFLRRGVSYLVREAGVRQILDIGSGLPGDGNVKEVAQAADPDVRVTYVDNDPIVLAHARAMLATDERTAAVPGDLRRPDELFDRVEAMQLLDLDEPFAVLLSGVVHHLADDEDPGGLVAAVRARLCPGSYLLLSHFLDDDEPRARALERACLYGGLGSGRFRTWTELHRYFDGLELVEPGLVYANDWRPDASTPNGSPVTTLYAGGVGRKP